MGTEMNKTIVDDRMWSVNLTPMGKNVLSKDVNKICSDDYAHTVHW